MPIDGLMWAGLIDNRIAVANANAYLYFALIGTTSSNLGLTSSPTVPASGTVAKRAYVFGQYSAFVRPGFFRIDTTHIPQSGVAVSAYQDTGSGKIAIVATNYTAGALTQGFSVINGPSFSSVTPFVTSPSLSIAAQSAVSVSGNFFSYSLPAQSVTTFVGTSAGGSAPVITSALSKQCPISLSGCSYQITATNSPTSFSASGLPPGLSVNTSTGLISGTPTTLGTSSVTLGATNGSGTGNATLSFTIDYFVQQAPPNTVHGVTSITIPFSANTRAGSLIVLGFDANSGAVVSSVVDTQGNTYVEAGTPQTTPGGFTIQVWYAQNIVGGADSVTVTYTTAPAELELYPTEYSGLSTTSPLDAQAGAIGTAGAASSGNMTTTVANDLIYGYCVGDGNCTVGSGFTARSVFNNNVAEDKIGATTGAYAATATGTSGWAIQGAAFKPSGSPTPSAIPAVSINFIGP
jgi:hypothetical protein